MLERELSGRDIRLMNRRVVGLIEAAAYRRSHSISNVGDTGFDGVNMRERHSNLFALLREVRSEKLSYVGSCRRCQGKRYLSGIDPPCVGCAGNGRDCSSCKGVLYKPCLRCSGTGQVTASDSPKPKPPRYKKFGRIGEIQVLFCKACDENTMHMWREYESPLQRKNGWGPSTTWHCGICGEDLFDYWRPNDWA